MITIDKEHITRLMLIEAYSERHKAKEKVKFFEKKYNIGLHDFQLQLKNADEEDFCAFDDYMEWKAYENYLSDIEHRIKELRSGNIQVA